jgi:hypothetical protein
VPADPRSGGAGGYPWAGAEGPANILAQASSVLAREAMRLAQAAGAATPAGGLTGGMPGATLPGGGLDLAGPAGRICPVTGAAVPLPGADKDQLRQQAHDLLAGLLPALGHPAGAVGTGAATEPAIPYGAFDKDRIRRQAHEFIETLLSTFSPATGEKGLPAEDKVPLMRAAAPVAAGGLARASLRVANDEATPSTVTLYSTNFVADSGYEIPALRVSPSPRVATIAPRGEAIFDIKIAIPAQTPPGTYSGLIQAMGNKYLKTVLLLEVS